MDPQNNTERLPPPPTYEEAQQYESQGNNVTSDDEGPAVSAPLLSEERQNSAQQINPSQRCSHGPNVFHQQTTAASSNLPVFVCYRCGASQQFGPMSPFLSQIVSSSSGTVNYNNPPTYIGTPVFANQYGIHGQPPGYPPTGTATPQISGAYSGTTSTPQQQCNVAVHYNAAQGATTVQPVTTDNADSSSTTDGDSSQTKEPKKCCCFCLVCVFVAIVCLIIATQAM